MIIGVIGGSECNSETRKTAYEVGKRIAERGDILISGGLGGVMEHSSRGAKEAGGMTIGILPGKTKGDANRFIDIPIVTNMSHARNAIIVRSADILIAINGKYGTLSEIGLALASDKKIIGINTWDIDGVKHVNSVDDAIEELDK